MIFWVSAGFFLSFSLFSGVGREPASAAFQALNSDRLFACGGRLAEVIGGRGAVLVLSARPARLVRPWAAGVVAGGVCCPAWP